MRELHNPCQNYEIQSNFNANNTIKTVPYGDSLKAFTREDPDDKKGLYSV